MMQLGIVLLVVAVVLLVIIGIRSVNQRRKKEEAIRAAAAQAVERKIAADELRGKTQALARMALVPLHALPPQEYTFIALRDPDSREVARLVSEIGLRVSEPMKVVWLKAGDDIIRVLCLGLAAMAFRLQPGKSYRFTKDEGEYRFMLVD